MQILKKVQFYKRALQALFALNIAILTAGAIAAISYFSSIQFVKVLTQQNIERLQLLSSIQSDLMALATEQSGKRPTYTHIKHVESLRFKLQAWPDGEFTQIALPENLEEAALPPELMKSIQERTFKEQARLRDQLGEAVQRLNSLTWQLSILGLCTLIFGILLPLYLFKRLQQGLMETRRKVEDQASKWITQWLDMHEKYEGKPLQDPIFWLKIILLSVETFAPHSRHPVAQYLGEFAPTLRKELDHERSRTSEKVKKSA